MSLHACALCWNCRVQIVDSGRSSYPASMCNPQSAIRDALGVRVDIPTPSGRRLPCIVISPDSLGGRRRRCKWEQGFYS